MTERARRTGQFALATTLSVVAYHLSVFGVFSLFSLQWVRSRLGVGPFLASAVLALAGILFLESGILALFHVKGPAVQMLGYLAPVPLIVGWIGIVMLERTGWRFLYRVLAMTVLAALVLFPLTASLMSHDEFKQSLASAFGEVWDKVSQTPGFGDATKGLGQSEFFKMTMDSALSVFLPVYFLMWLAAGRLSKYLESGKHQVLPGFRVPAQVTWVFLMLWGLILAQTLFVNGGTHWDLGFWKYVVTGAAIILLAIHLIAGLGAVEALMIRWGWPPLVRIVSRFGMLAVATSVNNGFIVLLTALPLLAVIELWVNLRTRTQEVGQ